MPSNRAPRHPSRHARWLVFSISFGLSALLFQGCSFMASDNDRAPRRPPRDLSQVPDPTPVYEPLSPRGNPHSYEVLGKTYTLLKSRFGYVQRGYASWYGTKFHGRLTANGEVYNMYAMTAAHKTLPLPVYARVTNLDNGKSIIVRINDRGPFHEGRIIDLSYAAAVKLDMLKTGTARVEVRTIDPRQGEQQAQQPEMTPPATAAAPQTAMVPPGNATDTASGDEQLYTTASKSRLYLQIASYNQQAAAEQFRQQMITRLQQPVEVIVSQVDGKPVYRVWVGPLATLAEADAVSARLQPLGISSPIIVVN